MNAVDLHEKAMALYDAALTARRSGDEAGFRLKVKDALEAESKAAKLFAQAHGLEPSRSVLYRSAATIAMAGCEFDKAIELAAAGLAAASVPSEIKAELVAVIKDANYRLHVLESDGITIGDESITMSLEGEAVGNGMVRHEVFKAKINSLVNIITRTIDRIQGVPFGKARTELSAPLYVSPPLPGSFAIDVRLGDQRQPDLEGVPDKIDVDAILEEVVESFLEFRDGDLDALRQRIPDEEYFSNFVGNGRSLQPDGAKITSVELVGNLHKGIKRVRLTMPKPKPVRPKKEQEKRPESVTLIGVLRVAEKRDEGKEHVEVIDDAGQWHLVHVPSALMADVVRPLWDMRVSIVASVGKRGSLELQTIDPV